MESKLGRTCQNPEVEVTEAIGGDQDVGLDQEGQEANEGQCDQQDCGDRGDCSLHQDPMFGFSGYNSNRNKDCREECEEFFLLIGIVMPTAAAGNFPEAAADKGGSNHDGDE